jgi:hypothetical protein
MQKEKGDSLAAILARIESKLDRLEKEVQSTNRILSQIGIEIPIIYKTLIYKEMKENELSIYLIFGIMQLNNLLNMHF